MEDVLGTSLPVFIGITVVIIGFAAFMTGQAVANTWRPVWQIVFYSVLLGGAARFMIFALYEGELFSLTGYLIDTVTLLGIGLFAYRLTRARKMVQQYPWLYERHGPFGWRPRGEQR